jgi:hypothetical protein
MGDVDDDCIFYRSARFIDDSRSGVIYLALFFSTLIAL